MNNLLNVVPVDSSVRISRERARVERNLPPWLQIDFVDPYEWRVKMRGHENSPYSAGWFRITVHFPPTYNLKPPKISFQTPIFHINLSTRAVIHRILLPDYWSPSYDILKVLGIIRDLMESPVIDAPCTDPISVQALGMYLTDKPRYNETARQWTLEHADDVVAEPEDD